MGLLSSGLINTVADTTAALHPEIDLKSLSQAEKFLGIANTGTDYIDYATYAEVKLLCVIDHTLLTFDKPSEMLILHPKAGTSSTGLTKSSGIWL